MNGFNKRKKEQAITLIALVITIIVLLILAGVTLSLTLGERGIFKTAERAAKNYTNSAEKEKGYLDELENTINNIVEGKDDNSHEPIPDRETLASKVQVGDYVAYDPTKGVTSKELLTYTSKVGTGMEHGNGASAFPQGQTFSVNSEKAKNIKWKVLSINEKTGEIVLTTENSIQTDTGTDFTITGFIGSLYAEQELNEICKIYGYGYGANTAKEFEYQTGFLEEEIAIEKITRSGARSMKVEDINQIVNYNPPTTGNSIGYKIYAPTKKTSNGKTTEIVTGNRDSTSYFYIGTDNLDSTSEIYKLLFTNGNNSQIQYWLASRCEWLDSNAKNGSGINFFTRKVTEGKVFQGYILGSWQEEITESSETNHAPVRPIVYLKSDIQTIGKDDNGAWILL